MAKRILIIGSTGMLGHVVLRRFLNNSNYDVFDISYRVKRRPETIILDVSNFALLKDAIIKIKPEVVINCVGVLINGSKKSSVNAILLNAALPHILLELSIQINFKVIHISTDCVFSGKHGNYSESSKKDADDTYGRTKALGEISGQNALTIRTSIIGPELKLRGEGLLHWFLTTENRELIGFKNVLWSGVTTLELARAIEFALDKNITGLWSLTNGGAISKFDVLNLFNKYVATRRKKLIIGDDKKKSNKSLSTDRNDIEFEINDYAEMIEEMFAYMKLFSIDYRHYHLE